MRKANRLVAGIFLLLYFLCLLPAPAKARTQTLRAWLVGCDRFVTYPDTGSCANNNIRKLAGALTEDARGFVSVSTAYNVVMDGREFARRAAAAFAGASEWDISFFYIATHGVYEEGAPAATFRMLLSDGQSEYQLTSLDLYQALSVIPGAKVLVIDTCNSGALIGKGLDVSDLSNHFTGGDFYVLTSAGGSEPSFMWSPPGGSVEGGSYFIDALIGGIGAAGRHAADENRDSAITLSEIYHYLLRAYGASTPHIYPQNDDFLFFSCRSNLPDRGDRLLTDLVYDTPVLVGNEKDFTFSYTLHRKARVAYHLVYDKEGAWQFSNAQIIPDNECPDGLTSPGRKERTLRLAEFDNSTSGYVLLYITTASENGQTPQRGTLLSVQPVAGDPELAVSLAPVPSAHGPAETAIRVRHSFPVSLTVRIKDAAGDTVSVLFYDQPSRPQRLPGNGSLFYWNGLTQDGSLAKPGFYRAEVTASVGGTRLTALSEPIELGRSLPLDALAGGDAAVERVLNGFNAADIVCPGNQGIGSAAPGDYDIAPFQRLVNQPHGDFFGHQALVHGDGQLIQHGQGRLQLGSYFNDVLRFRRLRSPHFL